MFEQSVNGDGGIMYWGMGYYVLWDILQKSFALHPSNSYIYTEHFLSVLHTPQAVYIHYT